MKKLVLLLFFACTIATTNAQGWRPGEMEVKVKLNSKADALELYNLKLNGDIYLKHALMYLTPAELKILDETSLNYEIIVADLNEHFTNFWDTREQYHSYQEIIDLADSLALHFPNICTKQIFGTSMGGRQLAALKISDNPSSDENEAEVLFDGGIHGDEIGGAENLIRFARDLCIAYGNDPEITDLIDNREIWLYLMVNPDGRVGMTRYNNNGVDLNRDWGYMWDGEGSSSGAYSQVESKSLRTISYNNQFVVHSTYHSGTEFVSYPWSYRASAAPDHSHIDQLAALYSNNSGYSYLEYGQGNTGMYPINGSTKDGNYGIMGAISWSIEISMSKQPPASQLMMYYNYNVPSMLTLIEYAGYGLEGTVTDALSGDPVAATVFVNNFIPSFTDPEVGDYHKYVLAGTYNILVKANGYADKLISGVSVTSLNSTVTNIELDPLDHQSVYKMISSQIPDNNSSDEGYTWNVIGQPDNLFYSIGKNGWAVLDMQDIIFDAAGPDVMVFEGDASAEGYTFYAGATMDGPWHSMGTGTGTAEFDFANCNISEARYFKIVDDGDGVANQNDAGFDLDAIQGLSSVTGPYIIMDGYVVDDANGNNNGLLDPGETADFIVTLKNVGTLEALAITGNFTTEDDYITIITTTTQSFGNIAINGSASATFTVSAEDDAPAGHTATINFNFEGTNVDPNTKYIMVPFPDYCYPDANCSYGDGFTGFILEDINNMNNGCSNNGYGDFTDMMTDLEPGQTYEITWQTGYSDQDASLWIDLNMDKIFGDDERLVTDMNLASAGTNYSTTIEIPGDALPGEKRLRIRANWQNSSADPCASFSYGETEDYTVNITGDILIAGFTSDAYEVCHGSDVHFYDNSQGNITSWAWEFPGGTPATSTEQNPVITYNSPGIYGVTLTVSDGTNQSTEAMLEYMIVYDDPATPEAPAGETEMCQDAPDCTYDVTPGSNTDWYWEILPAAAGTFTQTGPIIQVNWNPDFSGDVQIMAAAMNMCGQSEMSPPVSISILPFPAAASQIEGPDIVCHNQTIDFMVAIIGDALNYEWILDPVEAGTLTISNNECSIAFTGTYLGTATINVRGINDCGEGDWSPDFEVLIDPCPGIAEQASQDIQILPNPNHGQFSILLNTIHDETVNLELFSAQGEKVYQSTIIKENSNAAEVSLQNMASGIYYLKLSGNSTLITKKILVSQ
ncbi:MAG: T9SS type A sorting domain-containing protein [Bacteroidales bacterium]|nr:T9SS type A sorting domain-containing protein [Bacteroidales bacterium]